ncbi:uncharacterized protein [Typha latifolia]|uniref:uncharacterized protein n=1 Tax=Typha latifolia TaxID=4733 RepID=UPI003C2BD71E
MDSRGRKHKSCDGNMCTLILEPEVGLNKREEKEGEKNSLLVRVGKGGMARKGKKSSRRKVQWNDSNGKKLVEVLEYQPSDSSDSDDEYLDSCICTLM